MRGRIRIPTSLVVSFLLGCATGNSVRGENRERLLQLSIGMPKDQVLSVMGTGTKRFCSQSVFGCVHSLGLDWQSISNPFRNETVRSASGTSVEVLYYYTDLKHADGGITDDELTPIVLEDGRVAGWGWSFVDQSVQRYEIRMR